jgi:hypothetical protein
MGFEYYSVLSCIKIILIGYFVYSIYRLYYSKAHIGAFYFVCLGMLIGGLTGYLFRFNHDLNTVGTFHDWLCLPTLSFALIGAVLGFLVFSIVKSKGRG